jgi:hypothetical protein
VEVTGRRGIEGDDLAIDGAVCVCSWRRKKGRREGGASEGDGKSDMFDTASVKWVCATRAGWNAGLFFLGERRAAMLVSLTQPVRCFAACGHVAGPTHTAPTYSALHLSVTKSTLSSSSSSTDPPQMCSTPRSGTIASSHPAPWRITTVSWPT